MRSSNLRRAGIFTLAVGMILQVLVGVAVAVPDDDSPSSAKYECSDSHHSDTDHGANGDGGYQSTCDEDDFGGNGQEFGPGNQTGKPCAGCVGNADDKNPPGQHPDGGDPNSGYECDGRDRPTTGGNGNHGIGDENPAHTGCAGPTTSGETCPDGSPLPTTDRNGDGTVDTADCRVVVDDDDNDDDDTRTSRREVLSRELTTSPTSGPAQAPGELAFTDEGAAPSATLTLTSLPVTGAGDLTTPLLALGAAFLVLGGVLVWVARRTAAVTP